MYHKSIRKIFLTLILFLFVFSFLTAGKAMAQRAQISTPTLTEEEKIATESPTASESAKKEEKKIIEEEDLTKPEEEEARKEFLALFSKRPIDEPNILNFGGFIVQYAVRNGVPANTIILILLLPFLATLAVVFRQIIGVPTLEVLVPIALSITLVATGLTAGAILLGTILIASLVARFLLKRIRIMQLPKLAISMLIVSVFVFFSLVISASLGLVTVNQLSFFPVLLLILLSDKIVALQLARGSKPAITITFFTLVLGGIGYIILSVSIIRDYLVLYPEIILILIPVNIILGRYFGLRLTEYHRFAAFRKYVNQ